MALPKKTIEQRKALGAYPNPDTTPNKEPLTREEADRIAKEWVEKYAPKWINPYAKKTSSENTENEEIDPFD